MTRRTSVEGIPRAAALTAVRMQLDCVLIACNTLSGASRERWHCDGLPRLPSAVHGCHPIERTQTLRA
jgi:hypothetical protein